MYFRAALLVLSLCLASSVTGCSQKSETETSTGGDMGEMRDTSGTGERSIADANDSLPTAMDQGGSEADRTITQAIRQAVVANDSLSFDAKNVQIITSNGVVTLRGAVEEDGEKAFIVQAAQQTSGVMRVDDLIEVHAHTGS